MRLAHRRFVEEHAPGTEQGAVVARRREGGEAVGDLLDVAVVQGALLGGELVGRQGREAHDVLHPLSS